MSSKAVHLCSDALLLFSSFGLLLSVLFANTNLLENNYIIQRLDSSWNKSPISLIQSEKDVCSLSNSNSHSISNYYWPGNTKGCDCINIPWTAFKAHKYRGKFYSGSCKVNQTIAGCDEISETESFPLQKWRGNYLCHTDTNSSYFNLVSVDDKSECPLTMKKCGRIDSVGNILCVPLSDECPINHLKILNVTDRLAFEVSNQNYDGLILTEFHITDGNSPCLNPSENLFIEYDYKLFSERQVRSRKGCLSKVQGLSDQEYISQDDRYIKLDSYPKKDYYKQNGLYILDKLPMYHQVTGDNIINLFAAPYIGWKKQCMYIGEKSIIQEFSQLSVFLKKIEDNNKNIIFYTTILLLYIGIVVFMYKYKRAEIVEDQELNVPNDFLPIYFSIYTIFLAVNGYLFYLVSLNKSWIRLNQTNTTFFETLFNGNCSDSVTSASLKHFGLEFFANITKYNHMLIFVVINILGGIFLAAFAVLSKKRHYNIIEVESENKKQL